MNEEEIQRLMEKGVPVLDYYKEDTMVLIEGYDLKDMLNRVIQAKLDGKIPVVVIEEEFVSIARLEDRKEFHSRNQMLYRNIRMLTRHVEIVREVR